MLLVRYGACYMKGMTHVTCKVWCMLHERYDSCYLLGMVHVT